MTRWLVAVGGALIAVLAGYLLFLNPEPVTVRLTPARTVDCAARGRAARRVRGGGAAGGARRGGACERARLAELARRPPAAREAQARAGRPRARAAARVGRRLRAGAGRAPARRGRRADGGAARRAARRDVPARGQPRRTRAASSRRRSRKLGLDAQLLDLLAEIAERAGDLRGAAEALERARVAPARRARGSRAGCATSTPPSERWPEALALQGEISPARPRRRRRSRAEEQVLRGLRYQAALAETEPQALQSACSLGAGARGSRASSPRG